MGPILYSTHAIPLSNYPKNVHNKKFDMASRVKPPEWCPISYLGFSNVYVSRATQREATTQPKRVSNKDFFKISPSTTKKSQNALSCETCLVPDHELSLRFKTYSRRRVILFWRSHRPRELFLISEYNLASLATPTTYDSH